jgi:alpha-L-fucosidase 2
MKALVRVRAAAFLACALACFSTSASADVKLAPIFGDRMVLQAKELCTLWGTADPGEKVTLFTSWTTEEFATTADAAGHWQVKFYVPRAGGPFTLRVVGKNDVFLNNVAAGEVYLCSGQSNMEMPVGEYGGYSGVASWQAELRNADQPSIRFFNVKNAVASAPRSECEGRWSYCDPSSTRELSAAAYFFARKLHEELKVPIGLIEADWGGTPVEAWTSADTLAKFPEFQSALAELASSASKPRGPGEYRAALTAWSEKIDELDAGRGVDGQSDTRWSSPGFDDSAWEEIDVPATWSGELGRFDGIVWCRRAIDLPPQWSGRAAALELGVIDDMDATFVNGAKVGETIEGGYQAPRDYAVPAGALKAGRNLIAVRVLDTGGLGGINGRTQELVLRAKDSGETVSIAGRWRARAANTMKTLPERPHPPLVAPHQPTALYNAMIAPLVPYRLHGVLWYQGEANCDRAYAYRKLLPALIGDWRARFGQSDLPFYFVQIAPFAYREDRGEAAELREAQTMALSVPNTAMAVTMDIGEANDIHPKNKQAVGQRLALCALANLYGKSVESWGPMYKSMAIEGSSIRLSFDHARGLTTTGSELAHFTIAGSDQKFAPARAVIDGETVVVSSDAVKAPVAVRYCWGAADAGTLVNGAHLPAPSFRTDAWKGVTETSAVVPRRPLHMENGTLRLDAPIDRWDEGAPLGNGMMGVLVWGGGKVLKLSLDRGDLWDLRPAQTTQRPDWTYAKMKELVASRDEATFHELFDAPYDTVPHPTKIPAGRIEITADGADFKDGIALTPARGIVSGGGFHVFASSRFPVALALVPDGPKKIEIERPAGLDALGCKPATFGSDAAAQWMVQETPGGLTYAIVVGKGNGKLFTRGRNVAGTADGLEHLALAIAITSSDDAPDPLALGKARVAEALNEGFYRLQAVEEKRRQAFEDTSRVTLPDEEIQAHYDLVKYFYGAASRPGSPPMPLQGSWTADEGGLPPWKGDYHNDLNTEMTYLAYPTAGLFDAGKSWTDFNWKLLPRYRRFAREFYGVGGAVVPGVMALDGSPLGGWGMYSLSPTNGAWVAQSFYMHWRYTLDEDFLRDEAYPWCAEIGTALLGILKPDEHGKLALPLSSSPEIHDNSLGAWLAPNSNYDLALLRWLFGSLAEMAGAQHKDTDAARWRGALAHLDAFDLDSAGALTFAKGQPYKESHRHFSHALAIHPLGLLSIEGSDAERRIVNATLDGIRAQGTSAWCGYSFAWAACMMARCKRAEEALESLEKYVHGFVLRNGFHCNGDQSGTGLSSFTYRPFTLEGNFLGMQAVHEMLLQSWGGIVRVFPAVSARWPTVAFENLRAEGGFRVSAERREGRTVRVGVAADHSGVLRIQDPFDSGCSVGWKGAREVRSKDGVYEMTMLKGDSVLALAESSGR